MEKYKLILSSNPVDGFLNSFFENNIPKSKVVKFKFFIFKSSNFDFSSVYWVLMSNFLFNTVEYIHDVATGVNITDTGIEDRGWRGVPTFLILH